MRSGADRLTTSATFSITDINNSIGQPLEEADLAIEDGNLIFTRSVTADGKSKATCNGSTIPASLLSDLSVHLIEIHGQSANVQLVKSARQRELLDRFGGKQIAVALATYSEDFQRYTDIKARLKAMKNASSERENEIAEILRVSRIKRAHQSYEGVGK